LVSDAAAAAVAITLDLERGDTIVLNACTFAANLIKGVPIRALMDHVHSGGSSATYFGEVNALTPNAPSAVTQAGLATGTALANKIAGNRNVAVAFIDGDAAALGECKEALELASASHLPVLYVIHANPGGKLARLLSEMGGSAPVITVDSDDAVAVYRVAQESIARARYGGPSLIVCVPYRLNGAAQSATVNMERYLTAKKLFRNRWKDQAVAEFDREMRAACLPSGNPLA